MEFFKRMGRGMGEFWKAEKTPPAPEQRPANLSLYLGNGSEEQLKKRLREIKNNPDAFPGAEYKNVKLVRAGEERRGDNVKEHYVIEVPAKEPDKNKYDIAGYRTIQIFPDKKTVFLEMIEIFDGRQPKELSQGNFQRQGIGERSILALVDHLNKSGMRGWKIKTVATHRGFTADVFKNIFSAKEIPGGWDEFVGVVPTPEEAARKLEESKKNKPTKPGQN